MSADLPPIPPEDVARQPLPGMTAPDRFAFSPDDRLVTFLWSPDRTLTRQLYAYDPATQTQRLLVAPPGGGTTEENVSLEEALRRERQRQHAVGVTTYAWAERANRFLVPLAEGIFVQDGADAPLRRVVAAKGAPLLDPQLSPDGQWVAYVQDAELYIVPAAGGEPRQVTRGARGTGRTHGLAEYAAQEEMGRSHGYWWSPDGASLAFAEVDETQIPVYRITHQGKDAAAGEVPHEDHRYPFAGGPNARVRLGVVSVEGGEPVWLDLDPGDGYLARVDWLPDGDLAVQVENRAQTVLDLLRCNPRTGRATPLLREASDIWINLHDCFTPLRTTGGFIWASERTGYRHLYLYDADGALVRPLTSGEWLVEAVAGVDEARGLVYFTGTRESPLESHLYVVPLAGGEPRRITREPGLHAVTLDHARERFVDLYQSPETPPAARLRALVDGAPLGTIADEPDPRVAALDLRPPEIVSLQSRDGATLYGAIYRPPARFGPGPYPTIVGVYGGPHAQQVSRSWRLTANMRAQYLSRLGFLVFTLDNRGSARRGLAFEAPLKHHMGGIEVRDQVDGVRWLVARGLADPARVGIYGWSYGGYMTAMCLLQAPETFTVAVAGAPVTQWDGYDTHYTERYMGTPQENPQGYEESSVLHHAGNLAGRLMIVHGLTDENVHFRHTARLVNALIAARRPYDLLLFPDERHSPRRLADRVYMEERIADYFRQHL
ncbi:MAG TPA: S9 family peptidase [Thermomicrobiales bacterium]|nr:S9 family peptidase [Thermomicrobiales bacterium]